MSNDNRYTTSMSQAFPDRVEVRGRDLCVDLMGRLRRQKYSVNVSSPAMNRAQINEVPHHCGPMNVAMPNVVKAVPILARTAGLLGHLAEERRAPIYYMAGKANAAVEYVAPA